jgi:hypothetical protein
MVSGTVDLIRQANPNASEAQAALAVAQAQLLLDFGMGNGRIDIYRALAAAQQKPGGLYHVRPLRDQAAGVAKNAGREFRHCELKMKELESEVRELRSALVCSFNQLLDLPDLNTGVHSTRLAEWGLRVAS